MLKNSDDMFEQIVLFCIRQKQLAKIRFFSVQTEQRLKLFESQSEIKKGVQHKRVEFTQLDRQCCGNVLQHVANLKRIEKLQLKFVAAAERGIVAQPVTVLEQLRDLNAPVDDNVSEVPTEVQSSQSPDFGSESTFQSVSSNYIDFESDPIKAKLLVLFAAILME